MGEDVPLVGVTYRYAVTPIVIAAWEPVALSLGWPALLGRLVSDMRGWMVLAPGGGVDPWAALTAALSTLILALTPVLAAALICAVVVGLIQTRALATLAPLSPSLAHLRPSRRTAGERVYGVCMGTARAVGALLIGAHTLWQHGDQLLGAAGQAPPMVLMAASACVMDLALRVGLLMLSLALLDLLYQRWAHGRRLRMTWRQARRERREAEGDPGHRALRRRLHRELSAGQDLSAVGDADCVISGGPELAAALRYDGQTMTAPRVVVCGAGKAAAAIHDEAHVHGRPVVHRPGLARALALVEPGAELPRRLWEEAAEVLREVRKT